MDKSFDLGRLLRVKKHKEKPSQFSSVAGGVQKRLQANIKENKSNRLSLYDRIRNLPASPGQAGPSSSQPVVSEVISKSEYRRQQLEKWRAEKAEKKKQQDAQKKKPFMAVVRAPTLFACPPPLPKPSTSGRVTRSQTRNAIKPHSPTQSRCQSFAPKNAIFKPPQIKNLDKIPALVPPSSWRTKNNNNVTFQPVINTVKSLRSRTQNHQTATEPKPKTRNVQVETRSTRAKAKTETKSARTTKPQSSSDSSGESSKPSNKIIRRKKTPGPKKNMKNFQTSSDPKVLFPPSTPETSSDEQMTEKGLNSNSESGKDSGTDSSSLKEVTIMENQNLESPETDSSSIQELTIKENKNYESPGTDSSSMKEVTIMENKIHDSPIDLTSTSSESCVEIVNASSSLSTNRMSRKTLLHTPVNRVPRSESGSEEKLRASKSPSEKRHSKSPIDGKHIKSPIDEVLTPQQIETARKISPQITLSRGKDKARIEMKWKMETGLFKEKDEGDVENVDHFRRQLSAEIKRLTTMCDQWDDISQQTELPDSVQEAILSAVGQGRLLMREKLGQFGSLVERCANPDPAAGTVTPEDLQGFWDMVYMQVENVDMRFKKLEELRARGWVEEKPEPVAKKNVPKQVKKPVKSTAASSSLREMIAAKRRAIKKNEEQPSEEDKTFEGGFFSIKSPVRSPKAPATPMNKSLLKAVLSSEAKKASKSSTPFAILRASSLGKAVECDGFAPLPQTPLQPINYDATPGRSILKSTNSTISKSNKKPIKVLFDDSTFDMNDSFNNNNKSISSIEGVIALEKDKEIPDNEMKCAKENSENEMNLDKEISENEMEMEKEKEISENEMELEKENKKISVMELVRQNAVDIPSPRKTRSHRKTVDQKLIEEVNTPKTPRRSARKQNEAEKTQKKTEKTTRRSRKLLEEIEPNMVGDNPVTPKRSTRKSKVNE